MKKFTIHFKMILAIMCITFCLLTQCATVAFATWEITPAYTENVEALLPDTLALDIKEIEYEKANSEVKNTIINILKFNGIMTDELTIETTLGGLYELDDTATVNELKNESGLGIYKINVQISGENTNVSKVITLTYSNTTNQTAKDFSLLPEINFVQDLNLEGRTKGLEVTDPFAFIAELKTAAEEYYAPQIETDDSIKVVVQYECQQTGLNIFNRFDLAVFKDDVLQEVKFLGNIIAVPIIDVSETADMTEEEMENAITEKIQSCFPDYANDIVSMQNGWENSTAEGSENEQENYTTEPYTVVVRDSQNGTVKNWIMVRIANVVQTIEELPETLVDEDVLQTEEVPEETDFYLHYEFPKEETENIDTSTDTDILSDAILDDNIDTDIDNSSLLTDNNTIPLTEDIENVDNAINIEYNEQIDSIDNTDINSVE